MFPPNIKGDLQTNLKGSTICFAPHRHFFALDMMHSLYRLGDACPGIALFTPRAPEFTSDRKAIFYELIIFLRGIQNGKHFFGGEYSISPGGKRWSWIYVQSKQFFMNWSFFESNPKMVSTFFLVRENTIFPRDKEKVLIIFGFFSKNNEFL